MRSGVVSSFVAKQAGPRRAVRLAALVALAVGLLSPVAAWASTGPNAGFVVLNGLIYFSKLNSVSDEQLFRYDPASGTPTQLTSLPGTSSGMIAVGRLFPFNGQVFFAGRDANGLEPWHYDPVANSAAQLADVNPGAGSSNPSGFTVLGGKLYFAADDGSNGRQIWVYDPAASTTRVTSINAANGGASPRDLTAFNNRLYFSAFDNHLGATLTNSELWEYDPSTAGVQKFEINGGSPTSYDGSSFPTNLTVFNGKLYMQAMSGTSTAGRNNRELFVFDPGPRTVTLVTELNPPGDAGGDPTNFAVLNNKLYFSAFDGAQTRLWVFNPAGAGSTTKLLGPSSNLANVANLTAVSFDGKLYFSATSSAGQELWNLDPATDAATQLAGIAGDAPANFTEASGRLYLTPSSLSASNDVLAFDPSTATLSHLFGASAPVSATPASLASSNGVLFFLASSGGSRQLDNAVLPGSLIVSEFRLSGPGGAQDEFVELYNATNEGIFIQVPDGSGGFALVASDGVVRFSVPNGTSIPAHGHFLGVNSNAYSLANYGGAGNAAGNVTYTTDIPDDSGLALFASANAASFTRANRLDAVGFTPVVDPLYREGAGLAPIGSTTKQYAFLRNLGTGASKDTNVNSADFVLVSTDASLIGGTQSYLGAPGPENLASPLERNALISSTFIEPNLGPGVAPNRVRTPANIVTNGPLGTLEFRRRYTNNTGAPVSQLRFRVVNLTTLNSPGYAPGPGQSDLRLITGGDITVPSTSIGVTVVKGTTLETPPVQALGGGWNSTVTVALGGLLATGDTVDLNFLFGVVKGGTFQFFVNVEGLP